MNKKNATDLKKATLHSFFAVTGVLVLATGIFYSCKEPVGKEKTTHHSFLFSGDTSSPITITLTLGKEPSTPANKLMDGFNTAFTYGSGAEKDSRFVSLLQEAGAALLRFPGGTIANYYHPDAPGYGFRRKEMGTIKAFSGLLQYQDTVKENIKIPFAELVQKTGAKVILVANLVTGTPVETIGLLDFFRSRGVEVVAVELGNELYFNRYREQFPGISAYITAAKRYATAIRKEYPDIPLLVCAPGKMEDGSQGRQPPFFREWNEQLSREEFYNGCAVHAYFDLKECKSANKGHPMNGFACLYEKIQPGIIGQVSGLVDFMAVYYGPERKFWITEWNLNPPGYWSNTFAHGVVVASMLMDMAADTGVVAAAYHNMAAGNDNYAIVQAHKQSGKPINIQPTAAWHVFRQYDQLLKAKARKLRLSVESNSTENPDISAWKKGGDTTLLWFVNPRGNHYVLQIDGMIPAAASMQCIKGATFMSGAPGTTGKAGQWMLEEYPLNVRNLAIPPFSWGIIELVQ